VIDAIGLYTISSGRWSGQRKAKLLVDVIASISETKHLLGDEGHLDGV
jgi:hypothetical protein